MNLMLRHAQNHFNQTGLFKMYPELTTEMADYMELLNHDFSERKAVFSFEIPISTGVVNEEYTLRWDIGEIWKFNRQNRLPVESIPIDSPQVWSCPTKLNRDKLNQMLIQPKIEEPIIVAWHGGINYFLVIDGNHRYNAAKIRNDKFIDAIVLEPKVHLEFLCSPLQQIQFIMHHNIVMMLNHPRVKLKLSKDLNFGSFYPLIQKEYGFR